jgi:hypothetical protein
VRVFNEHIDRRQKVLVSRTFQHGRIVADPHHSVMCDRELRDAVDQPKLADIAQRDAFTSFTPGLILEAPVALPSVHWDYFGRIPVEGRGAANLVSFEHKYPVSGRNM